MYRVLLFTLLLLLCFPLGLDVIVDSTSPPDKKNLHRLASILTFEVVSNIMVDFSKIALATPICALCFSLFKSWNRKMHKEFNLISKCQDYEMYRIELTTISL